jgi:hypothetical protein
VSLEALEELVSADDIHIPDGKSKGSAAVIVVDPEPAPAFEETSLTDEDLAQLQLSVSPAPPLIRDELASAADATVEEDPRADLERGEGLSASLVDAARDTPALDPFAFQGAHLHEVPLALVPQQIAIVIRERGAVAEDDLPDALAERFGIQVPRNRRRLLVSFAWSAGGRNYIEHDGHGWRPGTEAPQPIEHLGTWTMTEIEDLVRDLVAAGVPPQDMFEQTLATVWTSTSRVPRPVAKAIGSCIYAVVGQH